MALPAAVSSTNHLPILTFYFKSACDEVKKMLFIEKKINQEVIKSHRKSNKKQQRTRELLKLHFKLIKYLTPSLQSEPALNKQWEKRLHSLLRKTNISESIPQIKFIKQLNIQSLIPHCLVLLTGIIQGVSNSFFCRRTQMKLFYITIRYMEVRCNSHPSPGQLKHPSCLKSHS